MENWKDCKVLNISRKKLLVYEGQYAFLPTSTETLPLIQNLEIDSDGYYKEADVNEHIQPAIVDARQIPASVHSVKSLRSHEYNRNI